MVLRIAVRLRRRIAAWAREASPEEACGALVGRRKGDERLIVEAVRLDNIAPAARHARFLIDPRRLADLARAAERRGLSVLGYFHSHPTGAAVPSRTDLAEAWPGYTYLIQPAEGSARAWRLGADEKRFEEETIRDGEEEPVDCLHDCATKTPMRAEQDQAAMVSFRYSTGGC